ncbi:hypothetical protein ACH4PU_03645 [Streptomyces sp. NPDC021100]|uniref:hypothetical protein n=1 Tax=Streptomyces sp. NPDC021100 TaxID=3365114 RepID=UPI00378C0388
MTPPAGDQEMSDDKASEGTWALPLLAVIPTVCLTFVTDPSTAWYVIAWVFWGLSAVLLAVGWTDVVRHGARGATGWTTCAIAHGVIGWQVAHLLA